VYVNVAVYCGSPPTADSETCQSNSTSVPTVNGSSLYAYNTPVGYACLGNSRFSDQSNQKTIWCKDDGQWSDNNVICFREYKPSQSGMKVVGSFIHYSASGVFERAVGYECGFIHYSASGVLERR